MSPFRLVVIACSAGGLRALLELLGSLPEGFDLPIVVAHHRGERRGLLRDLLARRARRRVIELDGPEVPAARTVYLAPAGSHLRFDALGRLTADPGPRIRFVQPNADVLFGSAAETYRENLIAVVLTGRGFDGAEGVRAVRARGGYVIAQSEHTAEFPAMPAAARATGKVDLVIPGPEIAFALGVLSTAA